MGKKDTATIRYLRQSKVFADTFNYYLYDGEPVIDPDSLVELDTRLLGLPYGGKAGAKQPVQRIRDLLRSVTLMMDEKVAYMMLALESQADIHYAMPVKNMICDALQYATQVEKAIESHKESGDYREADGGEYLSGFMKRDHLMPVLTLVVYFGPEKWDGPMSLHEMFEIQNPKILSLVPDYRINLITPEAIPDEDFHKFRSSLREVLSFIKYSRDAEQFSKLLEPGWNFHNLGRLEIDVLNYCVNAHLPVTRRKEGLDVCQAIQVLQERAAEKAAEKTRIATLRESIQNLMESMGLPAEQIMEGMKVSEGDRKILRPLLQ